MPAQPAEGRSKWAVVMELMMVSEVMVEAVVMVVDVEIEVMVRGQLCCKSIPTGTYQSLKSSSLLNP